MEEIIKKVIMASAGTGKTYRLSLEFISLLLKYKDIPDFEFSQIVVMTFTRKATAEIREKILAFLQELAEGGEDSAIIISNLEKISGYKWQKNDQDYIKNTLLNEILQRKDLLQVSTIDSFTTNIFKSMIAPYLRVKEFSIDNNSLDEIMPQLLDFIFSDEIFPIFEALLQRINIRTVEKLQGFIKSLINNRWILDYYENGTMTGDFSKALDLDQDLIEQIKVENWQVFKDSYLALVEEYNQKVFEPQDKPWTKHLLADYQRLAHLDEKANLNIVQVFQAIFSDPATLIKHISLFFKKPLPFAKSRKKEFKELVLNFEEKFAKILPSLADYYLKSEIIPQQQEVVSGWRILCKQYDKLKFTLGKFTYNDVTHYTYKYLYEESLSLIDRERGIVTNLFYEQLISRIRFLLIDEFQDTSFNQFSILIPIINELISGYSVKNYSGVIIVGDPKQSIYGWRGGERGIMEIMPAKLNTKAEDLTQCFRSSRPLIAMVNRIFTDEAFQNNCQDAKREWLYTPVTAKNWDAHNKCYLEEKEEGGELFYWEYDSYSAKKQHKTENDDSNENFDSSSEEQAGNSFEQFAQQLNLLHQRGKIAWGETAILVRTRKHAGKIADQLNKLNIPNNIESSGKLLEHKAVEILLTILKFKLFQDRFSLLHILRSDLVLLNAQTLTAILKLFQDNTNDHFQMNNWTELRQFPQCEKLLDLVNKEYSSLAHFITEVLANYDFKRVCLNEIDWKNIYTFLELVISFELAKVNTSSFDLFAFIEYCHKQLESDSEILQEGLQLEDSISILTVHKSKGLGFKNIFIYWELSNRKNPNKGDKFKLAYSFDKEKYSGLKDFIIYSSSSDETALANSNSQELMNDFNERNIIEAIDVFYVALTRAEHKLGLFFNYDNKNDFTDFIASLQDETAIIGLLITAYKSFFSENNADITSQEFLTQFHYFLAPHKNKIHQNKTADILKNEQTNFLQKYLTDFSQPKLKENIPRENLKKIYLEDRHQLFGNAAHEFLTYINYSDYDNNHKDHRTSITMASNMLYRKFGSLLSFHNIILVHHACINFIISNEEIFSHKWDKVFNEKTIFQNGKEYRIDRMMVNSTTKEVLIIDYKTGGVNDENQVDKYVEIIKELPFVKENGYTVTGKFMEVKIPADGVEIEK